MKGRMSTKMGNIVVANDVIAKYAGLAAVECSGVVGMAVVSVADGLVKLLKRESLSKGVKVEIENNKIKLDFHIIIVYGVRISAVSDNIISNVKYAVEQFTGMEISKINIFVEGVRVVD
ncbi:MAG: alkaline-shock protein [Clostridiales bacterium]|jgi:uncharacterized alkaline shock family protein YloU|nr:alkaline-shock protein [Clostridiales bacterium]